MKISKLNRIIPILLIITSFGPYLIPSIGIRLEHIFLYSFFIFYLITILVNKKGFVIKDLFFIFSIWSVLLLLISLRTLFDIQYNTGLGSIISEFETFLQPSIILFLMMFIPEDSLGNNGDLITIASKVLILILSINTLYSLLNIFLELDLINYYFWGGSETVASEAMTNGRYSGIFNQPMEAGVLYSLGLLCWNYINEKTKNLNVKKAISLIGLFVGGILSASKVFLFGGIFLFVLGNFKNKKLRKYLILIIMLFFFIGVPILSILSNYWSGLEYLLSFFDFSNGSLLETLTSGRFGENSQQVMLFNNVWEQHPVIGRGMGVNTVYDSQYFHIFGIGGSLALLLFFVIILFLVYSYLKNKLKYGETPETTMFILLIILIIGGGIGAPVLTLNRVSTIVWIFIGLMFQNFYLLNTSFNYKKIKL